MRHCSSDAPNAAGEIRHQRLGTRKGTDQSEWEAPSGCAGTPNSDLARRLPPSASEMEDAYRRKRKELENAARLPNGLLYVKPRGDSQKYLPSETGSFKQPAPLNFRRALPSAVALPPRFRRLPRVAPQTASPAVIDGRRSPLRGSDAGFTLRCRAARRNELPPAGRC